LKRRDCLETRERSILKWDEEVGILSENAGREAEMLEQVLKHGLTSR
jgi:hypothetical protein